MCECQKNIIVNFIIQKLKSKHTSLKKIYKLSKTKSCDSGFRIYLLTHKLWALTQLNPNFDPFKFNMTWGPNSNLKWFTLRTNLNLFDPNLDPEGSIPSSPNWTQILWPNFGPWRLEPTQSKIFLPWGLTWPKLNPNFPTLNPIQPYKMTALI